MPIPGQPGLYLPRGALRGLGDLRQDTIRVKLASVTASYNTTQTNAAKLLNAFGPMDANSLLSLGEAIKALKSRNATAIARLTGAQFAGIVRMGLAAAKGNIVRAEGITNGNLAGHETIVESLLGAAQGVIDAVGLIVNNATSAIGTATGSVGFAGTGGRGLGLVIADDVAIAAIVAVGVLVGVALLLGVYVYVHQSQVASETADRACVQDAAAGRPCTGEQWVTYRDRAVTQERNLSPIPDLNPLVAQAGSLLFWGGLAIVAAGIAYGGFITAPAAVNARAGLTRRSQSLRGLSGTTAQHRERAEKLLAKARREIKSGHYGDALVTASAANAEAQWVDERLKGATYHEIVMARAGLRLEG